MWVLVVGLIIVAIVLLISYTIKYDTILAFTGGLGSGKSFLSVKFSIKLLRKNRLKVKIYNLFHRKSKRPIPMLYSSIPVRISRKEWSLELKPEHCLLTSKVIERSVVFIDEVGSFASQFDFNLPNVRDNFNEFVRLFRHYTKGGYLVVNDQCSENINLYIRRRINTVYNLMRFKPWFKLFYTVRVRNISISEEIKTVEEQDTEDNTTLMIGVIPLFRRYDTYCYSEKYKTVSERREAPFAKYKRNHLLECPKERITKQTTNED